MKKLLTTLILLSFITIFSQEYHFDEKCVSTSTRIRPKIGKENSWKSFIYLNSMNNGYYMNQTLDGSMSYIVDNEINEVLSMKYIKSNVPYYSLQKRLKTQFEFGEKKIEKVVVEKIGDDEYLVRCFSRESSNSSNLEVKFKLINSKLPLVEIRFMDLSNLIHKIVYNSLKEKIDFKNFRILYSEVDYKNGYKFLYEFNQCEKNVISFNLTK